jgi:hypothetical protein
MIDTNPNTCEARIGAHLTSRMETFAALVKASQGAGVAELTDAELSEITGYMDTDREEYDGDPDKLQEEAQERIYELPLAVTESRMVRIDLSTGGPGDWLEAQIDTDGGITRITYWFNDWFDAAHRVLDGDDFDTAEAFIRNFIQD